MLSQCYLLLEKPDFLLQGKSLHVDYKTLRSGFQGGTKSTQLCWKAERSEKSDLCIPVDKLKKL